jgi:hypothetical protein
VSYYQDNWSEWLLIINFMQAVLPHESTGLALAYVDNGYIPRILFDWQAALPPQNLNMDKEEAQALVRHIQEVWNKAKEGIEYAQQLQKKQADKYQREINFGVGDKVMITTKD